MRKLLNSELGRKSIEEFRNAEKSIFAIVLDNVRSHNNVGSIFRTADAFLTKKIIFMRDNSNTSAQGYSENCSGCNRIG